MKPQLNIKSTTFVFFFLTLILLAGSHALANEFFLYWKYFWLDVPMHILGGIVVSLGFLSFFRHPFSQPYKKGLVTTLIVVLWVGLFWEVFEYAVDMSLTGETSYIGDTLFDILMDIVGGALGYTFARRVTTLDHV